MLSKSFTDIGLVRASKQFRTGRFRPLSGNFLLQDGYCLSFCKKGQESTEPHVGQCFLRVSHISGWYGPQNNSEQAVLGLFGAIFGRRMATV